MNAASVAVYVKRNARYLEQVLLGLPLQEKAGIPKMLCQCKHCLTDVKMDYFLY
jgi:hypothetical protein